MKRGGGEVFGGGAPVQVHQKRKELVEWAVESGFWNRLTPWGGLILTHRYNPTHPHTPKETAKLLSDQNHVVYQHNVVVSEKVAVRRLEDDRAKHLRITQAKQTGKWNALTPRRRRVLEALYGSQPLTTAEAVERLGSTEKNVSATEDRAFAALASDINPISREGKPYKKRPERVKLLQWALESGFWNVLLPWQCIVLESRYRAQNPLTVFQAAAELGVSYQGIIRKEKLAFIELQKYQKLKKFIEQKKIEGKWESLSAQEQKVMEARYGSHPKTVHEAAEALRISSRTIRAITKKALEKLHRDPNILK